MGQEKDTDITLKEFFTKVESYIKYLLGYWKTIAIAGLVVGIGLTILHINDVPRYKADLTFMLNEDESGGLGGLSGLLGQFGLMQGSSESNLDKIMELSRSRRITENALLDTIVVAGQKDLFANHLITSLSELDMWKQTGFLGIFKGSDSLDISDFKFSEVRTDQFNDKQNKAIKRLHLKLAGDATGSIAPDGLLKSSYNEVTGIMTFSLTSSNPDLSIQGVSKFFETLSEFYIEKSTEKQLYDYKIIKNKYDSIVGRLSAVQYQLAEFQDKNNQLFRRKDQLAEKQYRTEEQKLALMMGEAEKQVQLASLTLENKTPYIQLIDAPIKPLRPVNKSKIYYLIFGAFLGAFICIAFLVVRRMYREIMSN